jgi:hypothetical protein
MAGAFLACILVVHSSSADDAVGLERHQDRNPGKAILVTSAGKSASVLVWAMLLMGFPRRGWVVRRSFADALGHAHGGAVDIARSRSW